MFTLAIAPESRAIRKLIAGDGRVLDYFRFADNAGIGLLINTLR